MNERPVTELVMLHLGTSDFCLLAFTHALNPLYFYSSWIKQHFHPSLTEVCLQYEAGHTHIKTPRWLYRSKRSLSHTQWSLTKRTVCSWDGRRVSWHRISTSSFTHNRKTILIKLRGKKKLNVYFLFDNDNIQCTVHLLIMKVLDHIKCLYFS